MSVATPVPRSATRSTSTTSRAEPRSISANAQAWPTAPTPTTPTLSSMLEMVAAGGASVDRSCRSRVGQWTIDDGARAHTRQHLVKGRDVAAVVAELARLGEDVVRGGGGRKRDVLVVPGV